MCAVNVSSREEALPGFRIRIPALAKFVCLALVLANLQLPIFICLRQREGGNFGARQSHSPEEAV